MKLQFSFKLMCLASDYAAFEESDEREIGDCFERCRYKYAGTF